MRHFVLNSSRKGQVGDKIGVTPFKLDYSTENEPSLFEVTFVLSGKKYRYGFSADKTRVHREWLFVAKKVKETTLFVREFEQFDVHSGFAEGENLGEKTRENALFISVAAAFNGKVSEAVLNWFRDILSVHGARDFNLFQHRIEFFERLQNTVSKSDAVDLLKAADLGIENVDLEEINLDESKIPNELKEIFTENFIDKIGRPDSPKHFKLSAIHRKFQNGKPLGTVKLDWELEESTGTKKFFDLLGPILFSLASGRIVVVDELESSLHPLLSRKLVQLFQSPGTNQRNAQLVFVTHDTTLLNLVEFRRDQVWFAEKNDQHSSDLYSLAEIKVRKDAQFAKNYIKGRYGAVPYIGNFDDLVAKVQDDETDKKE
jgi:hypothetical protein